MMGFIIKFAGFLRRSAEPCSALNNLRCLVCITVALVNDLYIVCGGEPHAVQHTMVAIANDRFHGWPANNGVWQWGDEILVGFTQGDFLVRPGHNIAGIEENQLARSEDGGQTWTMVNPNGFMKDGNQQFRGSGKTPLTGPLDFLHPGFAMRIFAHGYHGNDDPEGGLFYSYNRGVDWMGPHSLHGLATEPKLAGHLLSPRTDYLVQGRHDCYVFISAHDDNKNLKRLAVIQTTDGGQTFQFVAWVTPKSADASAIMSQTVQLTENEFVMAFRKIYLDKHQRAEIETYQSLDKCRTWRRLGTVKVMDVHSNPPALLKLKDGRLCCIYGDRAVGQIQGRYSEDHGSSWGPEFVIRDDFQAMAVDPDSKQGVNADIGYPRLIQRLDGKLVAIYYWTTAQNPQQHIAASIWNP
jgi:hypothetical protein